MISEGTVRDSSLVPRPPREAEASSVPAGHPIAVEAHMSALAGRRYLTVRRSREDADRIAMSPEAVLSLPDSRAVRCLRRGIIAPPTGRP
jgi:hypothetical protein